MNIEVNGRKVYATSIKSLKVCFWLTLGRPLNRNIEVRKNNEHVIKYEIPRGRRRFWRSWQPCYKFPWNCDAAAVPIFPSIQEVVLDALRSHFHCFPRLQSEARISISSLPQWHSHLHLGQSDSQHLKWCLNFGSLPRPAVFRPLCPCF